MVRPAQFEVHGVHIVLQGDEIEPAPVLPIRKDPMKGRVIQPFVEVIEPGALPCEPRSAFIGGVVAAHGVEVGIAGCSEGVGEVEKCVHDSIVVESGSKSRNHSTGHVGVATPPLPPTSQPRHIDQWKTTWTGRSAITVRKNRQRTVRPTITAAVTRTRTTPLGSTKLNPHKALS